MHIWKILDESYSALYIIGAQCLWLILKPTSCTPKCLMSHPPLRTCDLDCKPLA